METKEQKEIRDLLKIETSHSSTKDEGESCQKVIWTLPNGSIHRDYGPALIYKSGRKVWFKNDLKHRDDGPAVITSLKEEQFWVNGKKLMKEEFEIWKLKNKKK